MIKLVDLDRMERDYVIAQTSAWWASVTRVEASARLLRRIPAMVQELRELREKCNAQAAELGAIRSEREPRLGTRLARALAVLEDVGVICFEEDKDG